MRRSAVVSLVFLAALVFVGGCDSGSEPDLGLPDIPEAISPADFVQDVDNRFWPLVPGTTFSYGWEASDGAAMTEEVEVLLEKRTVNGVQATVVWDRVYRESALVEEAWNWYAQDRDGNVWNLGNESYEWVNFIKRADPGSWESGVEGARAGVYMPAEPVVGDAYYQEYAKGKAQNVGEVLAVSQDVQVPAGVFKECIEIRETTPLDSEVLDKKYFCPGVGLVLTLDVVAGNLRQELMSWGGL